MSTITLFEQAQLAEAAYAQNQWGQTRKSMGSDSIDLLLGKEAVADETLPVNNHQANISPGLRAEERTEP